MYATDVRQHHRLMPPGRGHNNSAGISNPLILMYSLLLVWHGVKVPDFFQLFHTNLHSRLSGDLIQVIH